jgi:hypothetical protein
MFDCLEHALRRWEKLRPAAGRTPSSIELEAISGWLQNDVCRIVQDLLKRPDFRSMACWSMNNLIADDQSETRRLLGQIDSALRDTARGLAHALKARNFKRAFIDLEVIRRSAPHGEVPSPRQDQTATGTRCEEASLLDPVLTIVASDHPRKALAPEQEAQSAFNNLLRSLEFIASGPWRGLASVHDYFGSAVGLNLCDRSAWFGPNSESVFVSDFVPMLHPELRLPGDFIFRCLKIRIDYWRDYIQRAFVGAQFAVSRRNDPSDYQGALMEAQKDFESPYRELERRCRQDVESPQREAAMGLVQILYAYQPQTDSMWLGEAGRQKPMASTLRYYLENREEIDVAETIALSLHRLHEFHRSSVDVESQIAENVSSHRLCLIEGLGRREAYWKGALLTEVDWSRWARAWTLLSCLVHKALRGEAVDRFDVGNMSLKDARGELKRLLPRELFELTSVRSHEHRLNLSNDELYYGKVDADEALTEVT